MVQVMLSKFYMKTLWNIFKRYIENDLVSDETFSTMLGLVERFAKAHDTTNTTYTMLFTVSDASFIWEVLNQTIKSGVADKLITDIKEMMAVNEIILLFAVRIDEVLDGK